MPIWWNDKLMRWQVDEMKSWWNANLINWQVDRKLTKLQVDEMT